MARTSSTVLNKNGESRDFLAVQWLRLCASTAGGTGLIPDQETRILHVAQHSQKKKMVRMGVLVLFLISEEEL